jgi:hypothetical protein
MMLVLDGWPKLGQASVRIIDACIISLLDQGRASPNVPSARNSGMQP